MHRWIDLRWIDFPSPEEHFLSPATASEVKVVKFQRLPKDDLSSPSMRYDGKPTVHGRRWPKRVFCRWGAAWRGRCVQVVPHTIIVVLPSEWASHPNGGGSVFKRSGRSPIPMFAEAWFLVETINGGDGHKTFPPATQRSIQARFAGLGFR